MSKAERWFTLITAAVFSPAAGVLTFLMVHTGGGIDIKSGVVPPVFWSALIGLAVAAVVLILVLDIGENRSRTQRAGAGNGTPRRKRRRPRRPLRPSA